MPFTPSHAVVALAFPRTPLVPAAVAIGAMTPDLPLFFGIGISYESTHTFPGLVVVGLPVALALLIVWRLSLRPAISELTPTWFRERMPRDWLEPAASSWWSLWGGRSTRTRAKAVTLVAVSLVIGILSHVVWDLFTHPGRLGSVLIPALAGDWGPLPGYQWAQHASSAIGLVILAIWAGRWLAREGPVPTPARTPGILRIGAWVALPACLVAAVLIDSAANGFSLADFRGIAFRAGTAGAAAFLVVLGCLALVAQFASRFQR